MADYEKRPGNDTWHYCSSVARKARVGAGTFAILFATGCSDSLPTDLVEKRQSEVRLDRSESDPRQNAKSRQRTRIKFPKGETSEIFIERDKGHVFAMRRKDRSGKWHDVIREDGAASNATLIQDSEPEQSAVGTYVADGSLFPYGSEEWYDSAGVHWRVKSLGVSDKPPVEEVTYRNGILTMLHNYTWTRQIGGWLLTATRTDIYDYDSGGAFVAEVVDSLHHWTGTGATWYDRSSTNDIQFTLASTSGSFGCNEAFAFYLTSANCPTCSGEVADFAWGTAGVVASTVVLGSTFAPPPQSMERICCGEGGCLVGGFLGVLDEGYD